MSLYRVQGGDRLAATLRDAGDQLADLSAVNRAVGDLVVGRARSRTPVRSGRLVGSLTATGTPAGVETGSSLVYAGPIHNGWPAHHIAARPFLAETVRALEDEIVEHYLDELTDAVAGVHGA